MKTSDTEFESGKMPNLDQLERLLMQARDQRAQSLRDIFKEVARRLSGSMRSFRDFGRVISDRATSNVDAKALLIVGSIGASVAFVSSERAYAEERTASPGPAAVVQADNAALAAFGLEISTINESVDLGSLWRAVREVVLTKRVSDNTQQLIWRRVWRLDSTLAYNDGLDSDVPNFPAPEPNAVVEVEGTGVTR